MPTNSNCFSFSFKIWVKRVLLYLHIQVHPTWKNWDVFPFIWSFELICITLSITVPNSTSLLYRMPWSLTLKILLFYFKNDIPLEGRRGGAAMLRELRRFLNQLSNSPLLKFFRKLMIPPINIIVKVTPPPSCHWKMLVQIKKATNQKY